MLGPVGRAILEKLGMALSPIAILVEDESHRHAGHAGARPDGESHFAVSIAAPAFAGKRVIERHRMVNETLAEELKSRVHALAIKANAAEGEFVSLHADDGRMAALLKDAGLPIDDLDAANGNFIGLAKDGELLACCGLEATDGVALLRSLAVSRDARGQGYGQALALRLLNEARARRVKEVWLLTETAADFFARLGFVTAGRDNAPESIRATSQFSGKRCGSATAMRRAL